MRKIVGSSEAEYRRYKRLAEEQLCQAGPSGGNSVAALVWHVSGSLSRGSRHLSIPPGGSAACNANPVAEKPPGPSR